MRSDLPSGTVTFLFTDVEGSTRLLHELDAEGYADATRRAPAGDPGGVRLRGRCRGRHPGRRLLLRVPDRTGAFDAAWEEGVRMNLDEAVALALGEAARDA